MWPALCLCRSRVPHDLGDSASKYAQNKLISAILDELERQSTSESIRPQCSTDLELQDLVSSLHQCTLQDSLTKVSKLNGKNKLIEPTMQMLSDVIKQEVLRVDKELCDELRSRSDIAGTTSLLAALLPHTNQLLVANVGDSRAVLCDHQAKVILLSHDHKPNYPKELNRIREAGGFVRFNGVWRVGGILATSRAMGDFVLKDKNFLVATPEILTFDLNELKPKFVILATDGLWDVFSNEIAVKFVIEELRSLKNTSVWSNKGDLAAELARRLALKAYHCGSLDNISVLIWLFDYQSDFEISLPVRSEPIKPPRTPKVIRESDLMPDSPLLQPIRSKKMPLSPTSLCNARSLSSPVSSTTESPLLSIRDLTYSCAWQTENPVQ